MSLIEINSDMNNNYENRKHGEHSQIGNMQYNFITGFPNVGKENLFTSPLYFPAGEKIEESSFDKLNELVYAEENVMSMGRAR